ncbi:MAG: asparagine synthase (glutamine-hydrolyzing) [Nannocystaceae bacterium]
MCGLAAIVGLPPASIDGARILAALAHRGPDGRGAWSDDAAAVALFHTRLAILDLSAHGAQPMTSADGRLVLTYNGEIYNFRALRSELVARGHRFRTGTDTEVILALYREEGAAMLRRLDGIFALALFDRDRGALLVARDPMGVKPLYAIEGGGAFACASELKALLGLPILRPALDVQAIALYTRFLWCPSARTPMVGVTKVAPGEALLVEGGAVVRRWRYAPDPAGTIGPELGDGDPDEPFLIEPGPSNRLPAQVREALAAAVERQMVADVPVGAFLSGGVDSSAIAAFARHHAAGRLRCFTIDFDPALAQEEGITRDRPFAEAAARHLGVDLDVITVGPELAEELPRMVWHLDEPQADPAALNVLAISRLARRHGITVLLSGAGGDDLFSGYRRHRALALEPLWSRTPARLRRALEAAGAALPARPAALRRLAKLVARVGEDGDGRLAGAFEWLPRARARTLLHPDHRRALRDEEPLREALAAMPPGLSPLERTLRLEQRFFLIEHNLNYTDKMSMAAGVETRVPFLDPALRGLARAIPDRLRIRRGAVKWILKEALRPLLPPSILDRPKTGFGVPLRAWLRGPLRPLLHDLLAPASLRRRGLFDPDAVAGLIADQEAARGDHAYPLLALMCAEIWCRQFLDGDAPAP